MIYKFLGIIVRFTFKGPHDGIGDMKIKRSEYYYLAVQQNKVIISTAKEFADVANVYSRNKVLYLDKAEIQYPDLDEAKALPGHYF